MMYLPTIEELEQMNEKQLLALCKNGFFQLHAIESQKEQYGLPSKLEMISDPPIGSVPIHIKDIAAKLDDGDTLSPSESQEVKECALSTISMERQRMTETLGLKGTLLNLDALKEELRAFAAERDWDQFHSPKNLVMAINGEAGELADLFQWMTEEQSKELDYKHQLLAQEEIADVMIYLIRLADKLNVDLQKAIQDKMKKNRIKYPIEEAKGNATKYNRRDD